MKTLPKSSLEITGFAGVLERVYVMDAKKFKHHKFPESLDGFGELQYLAHAHFTPKGSTGMHKHENVDIITLVTHGEILHQGSLGNSEKITNGQLLIQRSGKKGFKHNEVNPNTERSSFIQIWMNPSEMVREEPEHLVIDLIAQKNTVYTGKFTCLQIVALNPNESFEIKKPFYAYLYEGSLEIENKTIDPETLFTDKNAQILTKTAVKMAVFYSLEE